jgi:hypothetical protein
MYNLIGFKNEKQSMPHYRNNSKTNIEIVEGDKIDTPNTQIYYL